MPDQIPFYPYDNAAALVESTMAELDRRIDQTMVIANTAIEELSSIGLPGEGTVPQYTLDAITPPAIVEPAPPSTNLFGTVDDLDIPGFEDFQNLLAGLDLEAIPEFVPPFTSLDIPDPPAPIDTSGAPQAPEINDITVPDDPNVQYPASPNLLDIITREAPTIVLPEFEDIAVTFEGTPVDTIVHWTEPVYQSDTLDAIRGTIQRWLQGGTGMTPEVEQALFDRARDKLDTIALKSTREAFNTFAAKGWTMPPGALAANVNAAQEEARQAGVDLASDILSKSAEWEQENLRQAVQSGIALEGQLIQQFMAVAQRVFEAAKTRVEQDVAMFGQFVALFNAKQASRQILVAVFEAKLKAALSKLDVYKAQLEGEQLKGQINETLARVYATQMEVVRAVVAVFQARVDAAKTKSEVERNKIEAFKAQVEAYATSITAQKTRFDAYESQMRGVGVKGQIVESYARAFAATVEGITGANNSKINFVRAKIDAIQAGVAKFAAQINAERDRIEAQAEAIRARASSFAADVQRFSAELGMNTELARLMQNLLELRLRNNLAYYEINVREYDSAMTRNIERARVTVTGLQAAGSAAAQLAAGAMSARHVQASLSGSGSASASNSVSSSTNTNIDSEG